MTPQFGSLKAWKRVIFISQMSKSTSNKGPGIRFMHAYLQEIMEEESQFNGKFTLARGGTSKLFIKSSRLFTLICPLWSN